MAKTEPSISFLLGDLDCEHGTKGDILPLNRSQRQPQKKDSLVTYFANSEIYSPRIPQRKSQELGEVCVSIFEDR